MKFEDLNIGAVIMHADRKENPAHRRDVACDEIPLFKS